MNYPITSELLEIINSYVPREKCAISTENRDWRGKAYRSDLVTIDEKNHVGFEVLENEIIVFYFTEHHHIEDYTADLEAGEPNYAERAKAFLHDLFTCRITQVKQYRGNTLTSEKYLFIHPDGTEECPAGPWVHSLWVRLIPFMKNRTERQSWCFDPTKCVFTAREPKVYDPDAVLCVDVSEDCYIEIFEKRGVYTYDVTEMDFDEYTGMYYWAPAANVLASGMYDTREKALDAAREALKCCGR